jgi:prolyl-tRNA editing enzyme YbaK/EbsC (Cys-tRNA(Pro) deacylase)
MVQAIIAKHKLPLEAGAVPPLPDIYGVEGIMDQALAAEHHIMFKSGNNSQLIQMAMKDFRALSPIRLGSFTEEMDVHLRCFSPPFCLGFG